MHNPSSRHSTILFLDDDFIEATEGARRTMHSPSLVAVSELHGSGNTWGCSFPSVHFDPVSGSYTAWYLAGQRSPFYSWFLLRARSDDGWTFRREPVKHRHVDLGCPAAGAFEPDSNLVFWLPPKMFGADVMYDMSESDPARRYKMAFIQGNDVKWGEHSFCGIAYSADSFIWRPDWSHPFLPPGRHSDTYHCLHRNSRTGIYHMIVRPGPADRRVAMIESKDLLSWTEPRLILEPDGDDPEATQFYGMSMTEYEGMWVGMLWVMHTPPANRGAAVGPMFAELVWSHDGRSWRRGPRQPFIPVRDPGQYGHGAIQATTLLTAPDGGIRIYANGFLVDHSQIWPTQEQAGRPPSQMLSFALRRCGFCSLRAGESGASIVTRPLAADAGALRVNCRIDGELRAELLDDQHSPIPGYTLADFQPVRGDHLSAPLRWRSSAPPPQAQRQPMRLRLTWSGGDLFSVRS